MKADERVSSSDGGEMSASSVTAVNRIYNLFAHVLDYPGPEISAEIQELAARLTASNSEAGQIVGKFEAELKGLRLGELQELYTSTFDMRPDRTTNLGCHLFGEDVRRNLFMAQLKERMEARRIPMGCELPDHLSLVLRLAAEESEDEVRALTADCLTPAITRILSTFENGGSSNPYAHALQALLAVLDADRIVTASSGPVDRAGA